MSGTVLSLKGTAVNKTKTLALMKLYASIVYTKLFREHSLRIWEDKKLNSILRAKVKSREIFLTGW